MTLRLHPRRLVLVVLSVVVVSVAFVRFRSTPRPSPLDQTLRGAAAQSAAADQSTVADVRLEALEAEHEAFEPLGRDLFRFKPRVVAPAPRPSVPAAKVEPSPPVVAGPPPPPVIPLKFIGLVEASQQTGRVAILSDNRGNVFYGREGDIIDGRYRVVKIGPETAELIYLDGRGRQVLRLSGQ